MGFGPHTGIAGFAECYDIRADLRPSVLTMDQLQGLVLTKVARKHVIMLVLHDSEVEVVGVRNIDAVVKLKESVRSDGPSSFRFRKVIRDRGVERKGSQDIGVKGVEIEYGGCAKGRSEEVSGAN